MKNSNLQNIKSSGFKTPYDYFDSLEDAVFSNLKANQFSEDINSTGFKVPENYFDNLDVQILNKIGKTNTPKVISLYNWRKFAYVSGVAASLILAFNLIFTNTNKVTFGNLETTSIETYLMNEDLNAYDIAPYLSINEMNTDDFVEITLNSSDIEDYLLQYSDVEHLISD